MNTNNKVITYSLIVIILTVGYWWWNNDVNVNQNRVGATVAQGCCTLGRREFSSTRSACILGRGRFSSDACPSTPTRPGPTGGGELVCCSISNQSIIERRPNVTQSECRSAGGSPLNMLPNCLVNNQISSFLTTDPISQFFNIPNYFNIMTSPNPVIPAMMNRPLTSDESDSVEGVRDQAIEGMIQALSGWWYPLGQTPQQNPTNPTVSNQSNQESQCGRSVSCRTSADCTSILAGTCRSGCCSDY